jgi:hypothetical protein
LIADQEAICRERAARLGRDAAERNSRDFDQLIVDFRLRQIEAILGWLETCKKELAP